ncbi:MAG: hypothetical protein WDN76_00505 [Alphaproteobacteria bacterium]
MTKATPLNGGPLSLRVLRRLADLPARIALTCGTRPGLVCVAAFACAAVNFAWIAHTYKLDPDTDALLASTNDESSARFKRAFPNFGDDLTLTVTGATPEIAEDVAADLTRRLQRRTDVFTSVARANGGPFFDETRWLYLTVPELRASLSDIVIARPMLNSLATDPNLRGFLAGLSLLASNAESDSPQRIQFNRWADDTRRVINQNAPSTQLSWGSLLGVESGRSSEVITLFPRADAMLDPPLLAISKAKTDLGFEDSDSVALSLTGASVATRQALNMALSLSRPLAFLTLILLATSLIATRSLRSVAATSLTAAMGAIFTVAAALLLFGSLNLISLAVAPIYFGFAFAFCIRVFMQSSSVDRFQSSISREQGDEIAPIAAIIASGFLSLYFVPFRGVAEFGVQMALGVTIAFALAVTVFPALLAILHAPKINQYPMLLARRSFRSALQNRSGAVLLAAAGISICAAIAVSSLVFDFNPARLRDPLPLETSTRHQPTAETYSINAVAKTLNEAALLSTRLAALPNVSVARTVTSFLPEDQDQKLAIISEVRSTLGVVPAPSANTAPPSDEDVIAALKRTAAHLRAIYRAPAPGAMLANEMEQLAYSSSQTRARVSDALLGGLPTARSRMDAALRARAIDIDDLPPELARQWLSPEGLARIEILPTHPLSDANEMRQFVDGVGKIAPAIAGRAVTSAHSSRTIIDALALAILLTVVAVIAILLLMSGGASTAILALLPALFAGLVTLASFACLQWHIDLQNMIALPTMLALGVALNIETVRTWRHTPNGVAPPLSYAAYFSTACIAAPFIALGLSLHPGTASMGAAITMSLAWILVTSLVVTPAMLSRFADDQRLIK